MEISLGFTSWNSMQQSWYLSQISLLPMLLLVPISSKTHPQWSQWYTNTTEGSILDSQGQMCCKACSPLRSVIAFEVWRIVTTSACRSTHQTSLRWSTIYTLRKRFYWQFLCLCRWQEEQGLFMCFSIHLELTDLLKATSFLLAFCRFVGRQGLPSTI